MDRLADITFGDVFRALARYRPVGVTVLAILLFVALVPTPRYARSGPEEAAPARFEPATGQPAATPPTSTPTTVAPAPDVASGPLPGFDTGAGSFDTDTSFTVDPSTTFTGSEEAAAPDTAFEPTPESQIGAGDSGSSSPTTLAVIASAWATATPAVPAQASGVPAGTLPVGRRLGRDDKVSYVRLAGEAESLRMREESSGNRAPITGTTGVRICPVTTDNWTPGENKSIDEIDFSTDGCIVGVREPDGTWVFDMSTFSAAVRNSTKGFALVPTADSAVDWQVTFAK